MPPKRKLPEVPPDAAEVRSGTNWLRMRPWMSSMMRGCSSVWPPTHAPGCRALSTVPGGAMMSIGRTAPALIGASPPITWKTPL